MSQFQFMKTAAYTWNVYAIDDIDCPGVKKAGVYELVARVVLDKIRDRYFIERPDWDEKSYKWRRESKPYLTTTAAFRAVTSPKLLD